MSDSIQKRKSYHFGLEHTYYPVPKKKRPVWPWIASMLAIAVIAYFLLPRWLT